ncbi:MAG: DevR family CRISPR-associated autoregulator [Caldilineales bacterium]
MTTSLYSLAISAQAVLDMHSLNNEGGEGNQIQTRMVNIVDKKGRLHSVNAISGDMFKHIQAEHFFRISTGELPLCAGCKAFNANRISADSTYNAYLSDKKVSDAAGLDRLLETCALDDMAGNLITAGNRSLPRKSVVEFGWVVALPEASATDSYFHVKYASERSGEQRKADSAEEARGANLGQAIFHRPANSGVYAVVSTIELARIGFNDITQRYAINAEERRQRHRALLESILYTFLQPNGAMRSTQHPHLLDFRGVVSLSNQVVPAPTLSPLNGDYDKELERITQQINRVRPGALTLLPFDSLSEFTAIMTDLVENSSPYALSYSA